MVSPVKRGRRPKRPRSPPPRASRARKRSPRDRIGRPCRDPNGRVWMFRHTIGTRCSPDRRHRRPRAGRATGPHPGWEKHVGTGRNDHGRKGTDPMSHGLLLAFEVTILVLAIFLGFEVISKVPTLLHTPLMSGTNAIHGIVIVGAMLVAGLGHKDTLTTVVGLVAVVLASANVVGGFVVSDRMLEMFRKREPAKTPAAAADGGAAGRDPSKPEVPPTQ